MDLWKIILLYNPVGVRFHVIFSQVYYVISYYHWFGRAMTALGWRTPVGFGGGDVRRRPETPSR